MTMNKMIVIGAAMSVSFIALTGCGGKSPAPPPPATHQCSDFSKDEATCKAQSSHHCSWDDGKKNMCAPAPGQAEFLAADKSGAICQQWGGKLFHQCECVSQCPAKTLRAIDWKQAKENDEKKVGSISWLAADIKTNEPVKKETNGQRCFGKIASVGQAGGNVVLNLQGDVGAQGACAFQTLTDVTPDQFTSLKVLNADDVHACSTAVSCAVDNASSKCIESSAKEPDTCASHNAKFGSSSFSCPGRCLKSCTSYCKPNDTKGKTTDLSCVNNKTDTGCQVTVNGKVENASDKICKLTKAADAKGGQCIGDYVNSTKIQ